MQEEKNDNGTADSAIDVDPDDIGFDKFAKYRGRHPMDYLDDNVLTYIRELESMALDHEGAVPWKIKLDALKELISRPLPPKTIQEMQGPSKFDRMDRGQLLGYVQKQLTELATKEGLALPPPASAPQPPEDDRED